MQITASADSIVRAFSKKAWCLALFGHFFAVDAVQSATFTPYTDRTAFLNDLSPTGSEDFNGFTSDASFENTSVNASNMIITGQTGNNGETLDGYDGNAGVTNRIDTLDPAFESGVNDDGVTVTSNSLYTFDNSSFLVGDLVGEDQFIRIDFDQEVTAWGADFSGYANDFIAEIDGEDVTLIDRNTTITAFDSGDNELGIVLPLLTEGIVTNFYGFYSDMPVAYILIGDNSPIIPPEYADAYLGNDVFGMDDVLFNAVPLPGAVYLFLTALGGFGILGSVRRRRSV